MENLLDKYGGVRVRLQKPENQRNTLAAGRRASWSVLLDAGVENKDVNGIMIAVASNRAYIANL